MDVDLCTYLTYSQFFVWKNNSVPQTEHIDSVWSDCKLVSQP